MATESTTGAAASAEASRAATITERSKRRISVHPLREVIADAQGVGHDGQGRVDRTARREETAVDHIQVVHLVRFAVAVERGAIRIIAEPDRPILVRHARQRNPLPYIQAAAEQALVAFVAVNRAGGLLFHELFQFGGETLVAFFIVW